MIHTYFPHDMNNKRIRHDWGGTFFDGVIGGLIGSAVLYGPFNEYGYGYANLFYDYPYIF